jgi:hypothetical protein
VREHASQDASPVKAVTIRQIAEAKILRRQHGRIARAGQSGIGQKDDPEVTHPAEWRQPPDPS